MNQLVRNFVIAGITTAFLAAPMTQVAVGQLQRSIINTSLENPVLGVRTIDFVDENFVPGWSTSHPIYTDCGVNCRPIEMWSTGFNDVFTASGAGDQFAELNADTNSMIYQTICMVSGESFDYSYLHRGRDSSEVVDQMEFRLGIPTGLPDGSKPEDSYDYPIQLNGTTSDGIFDAPTGTGIISAPVSMDNGWVQYSGNYTYTGPTQLVNVGFTAVSTGSGYISVGNFIDNWQIGLSPVAEISAPNSAVTEGTAVGGSNTPSNRPAFRIAGTLTAPASITLVVSGGTAAVGTDYSLSVPFQAGNTSNLVVVNVPAGVYDGVTTGLFPIPFSINTDNIIEAHETVNFSIQSASGLTLSSLTTCGSAAQTTHTFTINDDDAVTAAEVSISGQVVVNKVGLAGAAVTLTGYDGTVRTVKTNRFGYFSLGGVEAGSVYVLQAKHKFYEFIPQLYSVNEELSGLIISAVNVQ